LIFLSLLSLHFFIEFFLFYFADINVVEIEAKANEVLGPISSREDADVQDHLGGDCDNGLFFFFGIHASDRAITIGRRAAQANRVMKKGGQESSEASAPSARLKAIKK
jgi:hypothetical protein